MFPDPADGHNLINEKRITKQSLRNPFQFLARVQDLLGAFPSRKHPSQPFPDFSRECSGRLYDYFLAGDNWRMLAPLRLDTSSLLPSALIFTPTRVGLPVSGQIN